MAFALLANLPPVNGLYSSFFPLITYLFLGGIHQMVPGTSAQQPLQYWLRILSVFQNRDVWAHLVCQGFMGSHILAAQQDLTPATHGQIPPPGWLW